VEEIDAVKKDDGDEGLAAASVDEVEPDPTAAPELGAEDEDAPSASFASSADMV
jgi:hypothetical protein